jgi:hypothetical protein
MARRSIRSGRTIAMSFDPIDGNYQILAIPDDGAIALGIEEAFDRFRYQFQVFLRESIPPCPPTRVALFPVGPSPSRILGGIGLCPPLQAERARFGFNGNTFSSRISCFQLS